VFAFPAVGEIFTLAMQEAMASGIAVVTTDDPAYEGSLVAGQVVLCARNAQAFSAAIGTLLADRNQLKMLGAIGRQLAVEHFDWQQNFKRMLAMYSSALSPEKTS
jgi:glycosyltransferase involved in cell wall biosynthesis